MLPSSLSALKVCAANLVKLAKMITFQLSKNLSTNLSSAEMYHDILQGVVLCVNNLSVSLVENNTKKDDQKKAKASKNHERENSYRMQRNHTLEILGKKYSV